MGCCDIKRLAEIQKRMSTLTQKIITVLVILLYAGIIYAVPAFGSVSYKYDKKTTIIGSMKMHTVKEGESLIEIARNFNLGYNEITDANPGHDPFVPKTGSRIRIPALWILPDAEEHSGIIVNLSEMRLYYFFKKGKVFRLMTFPIGIGDDGKDTPLGKFTVVEKIENPDWNVPESIKKERPELPKVVPRGPDNPLGSHALRLSSMNILIHGTNKPWGVGRKVSYGCIRLYPEDIPMLFSIVPEGTSVAIVRQPVKIGNRDKKVYIEIHKDENLKDFNYYNEAARLLIKKGVLKNVDMKKVYQAIEEKDGVPVDISL